MVEPPDNCFTILSNKSFMGFIGPSGERSGKYDRVASKSSSGSILQNYACHQMERREGKEGKGLEGTEEQRRGGER